MTVRDIKKRHLHSKKTIDSQTVLSIQDYGTQLKTANKVEGYSFGQMVLNMRDFGWMVRQTGMEGLS